MDKLKYEKIAEVNGRWKADIIKSLLESNGIEVELVQEAITHYLYKSSFDPVQIFVPSMKIEEARELLKNILDVEQGEDEDRVWCGYAQPVERVRLHDLGKIEINPLCTLFWRDSSIRQKNRIIGGVYGQTYG